MEFDELLTQVIDLLQRQGRVSYSALKRRFHVDEGSLESHVVDAAWWFLDQVYQP